MAKEKEISTLVYDLTQEMRSNWESVTFFKKLLKIYGTADRSVEQAVLNDRSVNIASEVVEDNMERPDLAIRQRAYFRFLKNDEDVASSVEIVKKLKEVQNPKNKLQFIICCSHNLLYLYDLVLNDGLSIDLDDLPDNYAFLLPIKEGRKEKIISSQEADKKACLKLTRLLDTLAKYNNIEPTNMSKLNSFIRRILFCFFAEDTGIFKSSTDNMFTNAFDKLVDKHATNSIDFFEKLFLILNTKPEDRGQYKHKFPVEIMAFPYVNGGLFSDHGFIPEFNLATRNQLIDCGRLSWKEISPAIFGAMFQGAMKKDERRTLGAHYTSEENILKIVKPLFLDKLYAEFEQLKTDTAGLKKQIEKIPLLKNKRKNKIDGYPDDLSMEAIELDKKRKQIFKDFLARIGKMKFLDPACGCGNFLLISYKKLRELENEVLEYINEGAFSDSYININQFYGIEIEDWPAEIAYVSMWLMQHLMNQQTNARFGTNVESIPLKSSATIVTTNALTTDWNTILPAEECSYILGNPPFNGGLNLTDSQKKWLTNCYPHNYKIDRIDYVSAWYIKAADYMRLNKDIKTAFVSTNSICQGVQVPILWNLLLDKGIIINFAYTSFKWKNDAADKAGVTCIIVCFSYIDENDKFIVFTNEKEQKNSKIKCQCISPYLTNCKESIVVQKHDSPLSTQIQFTVGNLPADNGYLIFEYTEGLNFLHNYPEAAQFMRKFIGSNELMKSEFRYCLWLNENDKNKWSNISGINESKLIPFSSTFF